MANLNLAEAGIVARINQVLMTEFGGQYTINNDQLGVDIFKGVITGMAMAAKRLKEKGKKVAIVVKQKATTVIFGMIIEFIPGDSNEQGSWNTVWSFNPEDFAEEGMVIYDASQTPATADIAAGLANFQVAASPVDGSIGVLLTSSIEALHSLLEQSSNEEPFSVTLDGFFDASVELTDDGVKMYIFNPSESITGVAKADGDITVLLGEIKK